VDASEVAASGRSSDENVVVPDVSSAENVVVPGHPSAEDVVVSGVSSTKDVVVSASSSVPSDLLSSESVSHDNSSVLSRQVSVFCPRLTMVTYPLPHLVWTHVSPVPTKVALRHLEGTLPLSPSGYYKLSSLLATFLPMV